MTVSTPKDGIAKTPEEAQRLAVLEADYSAAIKPLRQLGAEHGMSHTNVTKLAAKLGWTRDLKAKIQAKAEAKVSKAAVSSGVDAETRKATESAVVEANAQLQYNIRMAHRRDIQRGRDLFSGLLTELESAGANVDGLLALFDAAHVPDPGEQRTKAQVEAAAKAREQLDKVLSMHARIDSGKRLVEMLEKLVRMERQAFGIGEDDEGDNPAHPSNAGQGGRTMSDAERAVRLARLLASGAPVPIPAGAAA